MKETIIKISKPIPKFQTQPDESGVQKEVNTQAQETKLPEELYQPDPEPTESEQSASMMFASTNSHGWKTSDILREIRLDRFEMGNED